MKYSLIIIGKREEKYIRHLLKELNKLPEKYEIIFVFPKNDPTWIIIEKEMRRNYKAVYDEERGSRTCKKFRF